MAFLDDIGAALPDLPVGYAFAPDFQKADKAGEAAPAGSAGGTAPAAISVAHLVDPAAHTATTAAGVHAAGPAGPSKPPKLGGATPAGPATPAVGTHAPAAVAQTPSQKLQPHQTADGAVLTPATPDQSGTAAMETGEPHNTHLEGGGNRNQAKTTLDAAPKPSKEEPAYRSPAGLHPATPDGPPAGAQAVHFQQKHGSATERTEGKTPQKTFVRRGLKTNKKGQVKFAYSYNPATVGAAAHEHDEFNLDAFKPKEEGSTASPRIMRVGKVDHGHKDASGKIVGKIEVFHPEHATAENPEGRKEWSHADWHENMTNAKSGFGDAYTASIDRRVRQYGRAVLNHVPRELLHDVNTKDMSVQQALKHMQDHADTAFHMYGERLDNSLKRSGIHDDDYAKGVIDFMHTRAGWHADARASLIGAMLFNSEEPEQSQLERVAKVAANYRTIAHAAEKMAGRGLVTSRIIAEVLNSPKFKELKTHAQHVALKVTKDAKSTARQDKLLKEINAGLPEGADKFKDWEALNAHLKAKKAVERAKTEPQTPEAKHAAHEERFQKRLKSLKDAGIETVADLEANKNSAKPMGSALDAKGNPIPADVFKKQGDEHFAELGRLAAEAQAKAQAKPAAQAAPAAAAPDATQAQAQASATTATNAAQPAAQAAPDATQQAAAQPVTPPAAAKPDPHAAPAVGALPGHVAASLAAIAAHNDGLAKKAAEMAPRAKTPEAQQAQALKATQHGNDAKMMDVLAKTGDINQALDAVLTTATPEQRKQQYDRLVQTLKNAGHSAAVEPLRARGEATQAAPAAQPTQAAAAPDGPTGPKPLSLEQHQAFTAKINGLQQQADDARAAGDDEEADYYDHEAALLRKVKGKQGDVSSAINEFYGPETDPTRTQHARDLMHQHLADVLGGQQQAQPDAVDQFQAASDADAAQGEQNRAANSTPVPDEPVAPGAGSPFTQDDGPVHDPSGSHEETMARQSAARAAAQPSPAPTDVATPDLSDAVEPTESDDATAGMPPLPEDGPVHDPSGSHEETMARQSAARAAANRDPAPTPEPTPAGDVPVVNAAPEPPPEPGAPAAPAPPAVANMPTPALDALGAKHAAGGSHSIGDALRAWMQDKNDHLDKTKAAQAPATPDSPAVEPPAAPPRDTPASRRAAKRLSNPTTAEVIATRAAKKEAEQAPATPPAPPAPATPDASEANSGPGAMHDAMRDLGMDIPAVTEADRNAVLDRRTPAEKRRDNKGKREDAQLAAITATNARIKEREDAREAARGAGKPPAPAAPAAPAAPDAPANPETEALAAAEAAAASSRAAQAKLEALRPQAPDADIPVAPAVPDDEPAVEPPTKEFIDWAHKESARAKTNPRAGEKGDLLHQLAMKGGDVDAAVNAHLNARYGTPVNGATHDPGDLKRVRGTILEALKNQFGKGAESWAVQMFAQGDKQRAAKAKAAKPVATPAVARRAGKPKDEGIPVEGDPADDGPDADEGYAKQQLALRAARGGAAAEPEVTVRGRGARAPADPEESPEGDEQHVTAAVDHAAAEHGIKSPQDKKAIGSVVSAVLKSHKAEPAAAKNDAWISKAVQKAVSGLKSGWGTAKEHLLPAFQSAAKHAVKAVVALAIASGALAPAHVAEANQAPRSAAASGVEAAAPDGDFKPAPEPALNEAAINAEPEYVPEGHRTKQDLQAAVADNDGIDTTETDKRNVKAAQKEAQPWFHAHASRYDDQTGEDGDVKPARTIDHEMPEPGSTDSTIANKALQVARENQAKGVTFHLGRADDKAADCAGTVAKILGRGRQSTDSIYADALGAQKDFELVRDPKGDAQPGDLIVYSSHPDEGTKTGREYGHVGILIDPKTGTIVDTSSSGKGTHYRSMPTVFASHGGIVVRYKGNVKKGEYLDWPEAAQIG